MRGRTSTIGAGREISSPILVGVVAGAALTLLFCGGPSAESPSGGGGDASAADDGSSDDAAAEDVAPAEAGPVPFCKSISPKPAFCDDFDSPPVGAGGVMYGHEGMYGGAAGPDTAVAKSAPSSERIYIGPYDAGSGKGGSAARARFAVDALPIPSTSFGVAFDLLVDALGDGQKLLFVEFPNSYDVTLSASATGATIFEEWVYPGYPKTTDLPSGIGAGRWLHVELEWAFAAADGGVSGTFTIRLDGAAIHAVPFAAATPTEYPSVALGTDEGTPPWTAHFDNLLIDVR